MLRILSAFFLLLAVATVYGRFVPKVNVLLTPSTASEIIMKRYMNSHSPMFNNVFNNLYQRYFDMSKWQMYTQGRPMDIQGRNAPSTAYEIITKYYRKRPRPMFNNLFGNMYRPERDFDKSNWQIDTQGHLMDMQGRNVNPNVYNWYGRQMYYPYQNNYRDGQFHPGWIHFKRTKQRDAKWIHMDK